MAADVTPEKPFMALRWAAIAAGPAAFLLAMAWLPESQAGAAGLSAAGRVTAALGLWMALWWITEAVPLAVTSLLPLVLLPLLGALSGTKAAAPYAHPLIYLFMGGFIIGLAMQKCGLHRRLALLVLLGAGERPARLVAGFMIATAAISMWISNTATAMMMLPIGKSVIDTLRERAGRLDAGQERAYVNFGAALMLGIAFAASIGGIGTLVGTPPNLIFAAFVEKQYGAQVAMIEWMKMGVPLMLVLLPLAWLLLVGVACRFPGLRLAGGRDVVRSGFAALGPMSRGEWTVLAVFLLTAAGWVLQPQLARWTGLAELNDTAIALTGAILLFIIPVGGRPSAFAMDWKTACTLPWDILILFGGGLSLAAALTANHVDVYLAAKLMGAAGIHPLLFLLLLAGAITLLSEVASNTAVAAALMPVLAAAALATNMPPAPLLAVAALASSCGFMLPVATPPNAIVYGSGYVPLSRMIRAGLALDVIGVLVIAGYVHFVGHPAF